MKISPFQSRQENKRFENSNYRSFFFEWYRRSVQYLNRIWLSLANENTVWVQPKWESILVCTVIVLIVIWWWRILALGTESFSSPIRSCILILVHTAASVGLRSEELCSVTLVVPGVPTKGAKLFTTFHNKIVYWHQHVIDVS